MFKNMVIYRVYKKYYIYLLYTISIDVLILYVYEFKVLNVFPCRYTFLVFCLFYNVIFLFCEQLFRLKKSNRSLGIKSFLIKKTNFVSTLNRSFYDF